MLGVILFLLIVFFTYKLQFVKLAVILALIIPYLGKKYLSKRVASWVFALIGFELFAILVAIIRGNPAPFVSFRVMVIWPIFYLLLLKLVDYGYWVKLDKLISYALLMLQIIGLFACIKFNISGAFDDKFLNFESQVRPNYPVIAIGGGGVVIFMILYFYVLSKSLLGISRVPKIDVINIVFGVLFILITSRRALILNFILVYFVLFLILTFNKNTLKKEKQHILKYMPYFIIIILIGGVYLISKGFLDITSMSDFIFEAFDSEEEGGRKIQMASLIQGWLDSPIWGNGVGVNAGISRAEVPGAYELSYFAMLFAKGMIGFVGFWVLIFVLYGWTLRAALSTPKYKDGICVLVSLTMFLIANASNPYLGAFDFLWILFWPLVFVNMYDLDRKKGKLNRIKNEGIDTNKSL